MAKKSGGKKQSGRRPAKETGLVPKGYDEFLGQLKERIRTAQLRASVAVNRELIELLLADWARHHRTPKRPGSDGAIPSLIAWAKDLQEASSRE